MIGRRAWIVAVALVAVCGCSGSERVAHVEDDHDHGSAHDDHAEIPRGPHGGWLFTDDGAQVELRIEEEDGPPMFVAYLFDGGGNPVAPSGAALRVVLDRFAGRRDSIEFREEGTHLRGIDEVREPHSFTVRVALERSGENHEWTLEQEEFRIELTPESARAGGIRTERAAPRSIAVQVRTPGEVRLDAERMILVRPRFDGIVSRLPFRLGDDVAPGDTLALVQANESLHDYAITAPIAGTLVSRSVAVGAAVDRETVLFTLADLSRVWVDFAIYPQHIGVVRKGQAVRITSSSAPGLVADGTLSYVGPLLEQDTRVSYGRVVLPNRGGHWQPGLYVRAEITVERREAPITVPESAIVRSGFGPAVFVADGTTYELQPVRRGASDGVHVAIEEGLSPGMEIVVENAFVLKAELGKSDATHDH
jgi:cobalt-zinc-cadmium efflux system membrane fusion protein